MQQEPPLQLPSAPEYPFPPDVSLVGKSRVESFSLLRGDEVVLGVEVDATDERDEVKLEAGVDVGVHAGIAVDVVVAIRDDSADGDEDFDRHRDSSGITTPASAPASAPAPAPAPAPAQDTSPAPETTAVLASEGGGGSLGRDKTAIIFMSCRWSSKSEAMAVPMQFRSAHKLPVGMETSMLIPR